jgi:mannose-6-phosphate isomerase-like protein (cupin superfamily)
MGKTAYVRACVRTSMAVVAVALVLALPRSAHAQAATTSAAPDMTRGTYMSAADAAAAVAVTAAKQGTSPNGITRVLQLAPYTVSIEHRIPVAQSAAIHDKDAELFVVIDGSATLVTGGTLVNPTRNGDNVSGTAITGGTSQKMSKGDFMLIPQGVAHWITDIQGSFTPMTLHLPMVK